ncbi:metallophosphoesterase [Rhodococcus wratislaviensis]|uniref:Putative 3',5'-cyclic-nucleotide phosphodiesterase n=1 Tax=Rhodococcus wratislaviensis NBRC 100605 TaxID=1219028 RepID=X0PLF5_RHOWR|nr:metallophosphoesterase [Rhodococcus wratislaviensis]GAF43299.1 putative 3',5'-cyclic-nucleotide phosphodiesterase [Rhodococcus wratislaviensis NBRC 100605]
MSTAARPSDDLTIVQLTDTHITAGGTLVHDAVDTLDSLRRTLDRIVGSGRRVDALVLSGDLTDNGAPEAYRRLRAVVEPAAASLGARIVYAMGNHDERAAFGTELCGRGAKDAAGLTAPYDAVHEVHGLRIVVLDSTTPGRHEGWLTDTQLDWLRGALSRPSARGTLLVLHHPPIPSPVTTVNYLRLQDPDRLAAVLAGSDVRMILCGHAHLTGTGAVAGIPVWVGPALSYRVDPLAPVGRHRGHAGYGFTRIDVLGDAVVATAVEATPAEVVYDIPEQDMLDRLRALALEAG